jgi:SAM-dependent methyltransferase
MNNHIHNAEPAYARYLSRLVRPFSNFDFFFIKGVRQTAVRALHLKAGEQVLDLGCGGGASFPFLLNAVGTTGKVIGIDISRQSCINALRRVKHNGWRNVTVINLPADSVALSANYDAALMFAAPDVYASETALTHLLPHLKARARVVIFGAKITQGRLGWILNPFFLFMCRKFSPGTPVPDAQPWSLLACHLDDLEITEFFFGAMFLASGTFKKK